MLDTGIDVPEVVNLVFFKLVRSKTKFWQMVGRGTRLCPDLFGPGQDKEFFYVFDYCQNLEFFSQNPATTDGAHGESLGKRLFKTRLELIGALDQRLADVGIGPFAPSTEVRERRSRVRRPGVDRSRRDGDTPAVASRRDEPRQLHRPPEAAVRGDVCAGRGVDERWPRNRSESWRDEVAALPTELTDEDEEAKRFDLLMLNLQLAVLHAEPAFERLREQVRSIAGLLEEKSSIPMVREQMPLIEAVAGRRVVAGRDGADAGDGSQAAAPAHQADREGAAQADLHGLRRPDGRGDGDRHAGVRQRRRPRAVPWRRRASS